MTIDSAKKQRVIDKLFDGVFRLHYFWLGASNKFNVSGNDFCNFIWLSTGEQFTYTNWEDMHSCGIRDSQHCVQIYASTRRWTTLECDFTSGFICEDKQFPESSNKNIVQQQFVKDFELKFLSLLKDNMIQLNGRLENIERLCNNTKDEVEKFTYKHELSTKELKNEITKQGNDLKDQLYRSVDEINAKFNEKQNVIQNE